MSKSLVWMGASLKDLRDLPPDVRLEIGHALREAQDGGKAKAAKPMTGKGYGASVLEIVEDFNTDTYRCGYTVKFEEAIYVLHSFQKKSSQGVKTTQRDVDIINARLKDAEELHKQWLRLEKAKGPQGKSAKHKER